MIPTAVLTPKLAIERVAPNPSRSLPDQVSFTLAGEEEARFELVDIAGRVLWERDLGHLGPGRHDVAIGPGNGLPAGVYWLRLIEGAGRATAPVVVIR